MPTTSPPSTMGPAQWLPACWYPACWFLARLELESRYGRRAIMELSYDLAMARFYPTVKRALGYAKSCSAIRLRVA